MRFRRATFASCFRMKPRALGLCAAGASSPADSQRFALPRSGPSRRRGPAPVSRRRESRASRRTPREGEDRCLSAPRLATEPVTAASLRAPASLLDASSSPSCRRPRERRGLEPTTSLAASRGHLPSAAPRRATPSWWPRCLPPFGSGVTLGIAPSSPCRASRSRRPRMRELQAGEPAPF